MADEDAKEEAEAPGAPDDEDFDDDEEGAPKPSRFRGKAKLFIIIGAVVLLLVGAGAGVYMTGLLDSLLGLEKPATTDESVFVRGKVFYKLEDITLNLNVEGKKPQFLKIGLTVVLLKEEDIPRIEALLPRITDSVSNYLRELDPDELKGSANFYRVRENLLIRVRVVVAPIRVTNVLFNSVLVQ